MSNFFHSCVDTFLGTSGYVGGYQQQNNRPTVYRNYNTISSRQQGPAYANQRMYGQSQSFTYDIDTLTFAPESLGWQIIKEIVL